MRAGIEIIKTYEGLELKAYKCPAGVWTIGYGATFYQDFSKVKPTDVITKDAAEALLEFHYDLFEERVKKLVKVNINGNQLGALVSFTFNLGEGNLSKSTLLRVLNEGNYEQAAEEFLKWNKSNGKVLNGLVKRRESERALFKSEIPSFNVSSSEVLESRNQEGLTLDMNFTSLSFLDKFKKFIGTK